MPLESKFFRGLFNALILSALFWLALWFGIRWLL